MALTIGTQLGSHEITGLLGKGGMGEVYRARDLKLKREVAIKILPEGFSRDIERLSRFQREAEVLASLNHPNIAAIHDLEETNGTRYLVLELVEGETLADRIARGPIPVEQGLAIAKQLCEALEAAHERGIIHRDLKPANIKLTPDGKVKVLDFGLAKAMATEVAPNANLSNSPTIMSAASMPGVILGTAPYMSPEQAKGRAVDKRTDIFAFGCVLYEMLTGKPTFDGDDVSQIIAHVLARDPDWERLPATIPSRIREVLRLCLEKNVKNRLSDATDVRLLIEQALRELDAPAAEIAPPKSSRRREYLWAAAAFALLLTTAGLATRAVLAPAPELQVEQFSVLRPENALKNGGDIPQISPDGRRIIMSVSIDGQASASLWLRDLDSLNGRILPGTSGASYPFWSPDSRRVGFFADNRLKKIDVTGGPALTLCDTGPQVRGGSWNQDDVIVYGRSEGGLFRVPAAGGTAVALTEPDATAGEFSHRWPWFLPDGHHFLYTARTGGGAQKTRIYADSIDAKPGVKTRKEVVAADFNAVYESGYLLFVRERTLMAQPFDASKFQTTGDAVRIAEEVDYFSGNGLSHFSASRNGTLVYSSGASGGNKKQLTWFDRNGKSGGTVGMPADIGGIRISPDGSTVAIDRGGETGGHDIWLHDLARGRETQFTFGPGAMAYAVWSGDGSRIALNAGGPADATVTVKPSNGVGAPEALDKDPRPGRIDDWSRDGRYIIKELIDPKNRADIWVLPQFGDKKPFPYLNSEYAEGNARLSPNGQWLAYISDELKRPEVYVQTFPEHGGKWRISTSGGQAPVWSRDGRELYFIGADRKLTAVEVKDDGKSFQASVPNPLFEVAAIAPFDVSKDGHFLIQVPVDQAATNVPLTVVMNWPAALKK